jgi:hypothetical protein
MTDPPPSKRPRIETKKLTSTTTAQQDQGQELDGWVYLDKATLISQSPSLAGGMPLELEEKKRFIGCQYINDLCQHLSIRHVPRCVAHGLFHRFYARQSFKTHPEMDVATTCVFLSIKIEEVKEITLSKVLAAEKVVRKNTMERRTSSQGFSSTIKKKLDQEKVLVLERVLLHSIAFEICITTPFNYLRKLKQHVAKNEPEKWKKLYQLAYQFIIDSHGTTLVLQFPPHVLACAAIYLGSKFAKLDLQDLTYGKKLTRDKHWWQDLPGGESKKINRDDLLDCCHQMLAVFEKESCTCTADGTSCKCY